MVDVCVFVDGERFEGEKRLCKVADGVHQPGQAVSTGIPVLSDMTNWLSFVGIEI